MILADTSAWIEYLRRTESPAHHRLRGIVETRGELATTEVVVMELLAGARTDAEREALGRMLAPFPLLPVEGLGDWEAAADLYRASRRGGEPVRKLTDCLIAAVAIREGASVLHRDADFDVLSRHTSLQVDQ
ncbi:MAG: PIN domain nuclease [Actinobacteria bacterium]|nr:PIN domain nuclease [Actinomycetota bacterium]